MTTTSDLVQTVKCLISSEVIGLNPDGSVWVNGGRNWNDGRTAWIRGEPYAAPGSPMAYAIKLVIDSDRKCVTASQPVVFPAANWTVCPVCGDEINVDDPACWATVNGVRRVVCESCAPEAEERW